MDEVKMERMFGVPIVVTEAVPPDTVLFVPAVVARPRPGETLTEWAERVLAAVTVRTRADVIAITGLGR